MNKEFDLFSSDGFKNYLNFCSNCGTELILNYDFSLPFCVECRIKIQDDLMEKLEEGVSQKSVNCDELFKDCEGCDEL